MNIFFLIELKKIEILTDCESYRNIIDNTNQINSKMSNQQIVLANGVNRQAKVETIPQYIPENNMNAFNLFNAMQPKLRMNTQNADQGNMIPFNNMQPTFGLSPKSDVPQCYGRAWTSLSPVYTTEICNATTDELKRICRQPNNGIEQPCKKQCCQVILAPGYEYCSKHMGICRFKDCPKPARKGFEYCCKEHAGICKKLGCQNPPQQGFEYCCKVHANICKKPGCQNPPQQGFEYCSEQCAGFCVVYGNKMCSNPKCSKPAALNQMYCGKGCAGLCVSLKCKSRALTGQDHCSHHQDSCIIPGCSNKPSIPGQHCQHCFNQIQYSNRFPKVGSSLVRETTRILDFDANGNVVRATQTIKEGFYL